LVRDDVVSQFPGTPFEQSRSRGGRFAWLIPRVKVQRGVLMQRSRFRFILATTFNSVDYSQESIQIPSGRVRRRRQQLSSNGSIERAQRNVRGFTSS